MGHNATQTDIFQIEEDSSQGEDDGRSLLTDLLETSKIYHQTNDYKELLDFVKRLRNFAPFNAFLLQLQKPGLRFATSEYEWNIKFNRTIKESARPLIILWPFAPVALVYDIEDTEGGPLPNDVEHAFHASGNIRKINFNEYIKLLAKKGIELKLIYCGDADAGHIQVIEPSYDVKQVPKYHIRLNQKHTPNVQFATLIHELAHLYLGHLGPDRYLKIKNNSNKKHSEQELEAESVSYIVCDRSGVSTKSESYLVDYVDENTTIESIDLYTLLRAAGQIESLLNLAEHIKFK
jgi:hypothetical protein